MNFYQDFYFFNYKKRINLLHVTNISYFCIVVTN